MHELSICNSIVDIVTKHAEERPVRSVHVRVGALRQIVPDTLVYCWSLVSKDTVLDGSQLQVESIPARIQCSECDHTTTLTAPVLRCESCDSQAVTLVTGEEFLITSLELAEA